MKVRLHSSGHYPTRVVEVTEEEFNDLLLREQEYGAVSASVHGWVGKPGMGGGDKLDEIYDRPQQDDTPSLCWYE